MRVGTGFDLHRLGADQPLRLGGVEVPGSPGLVGHSDADCVLHAITDALLGASGLNLDIGALFPDTDPAFKDADSAGLLAEALQRVRDAGFEVVNVDCTILAERPKIGPHRDAMRDRIAAILGVGADRVGVKATTMEGFGAIGRAEAIACQAVCLLAPKDEVR